LGEIITQAQVCRAEITKLYPAKGATPGEVVESLQAIRPWLDELETLVVALRRYRSVSERALATAKSAAEDRWDQAARGKGGSVRDAGPRERYAHFNLESFEERRTQREAEALHSETTAAFDAVQAMFRGAESIRHDLHVLIRAAQFESSLER
jgi:hypothetical protein